MRCESCREFLDLEGARYCPGCGATIPEPPPDPLIGKSIGGRYEIRSLVAEGGMGRVYAAEQQMGTTRRKVAIKVLLSEYSGRELDVQRFLRECSTVSELDHPNTIKFYDYGETEDGDLYIAMEFLSGQSLAQELKKGAISPDRVDLIVGQICGSLQEAHDRGIIHRDLKPDNVVLTSPGGQPDFVKVLDFGIAKRLGGKDPKLTPLGVVLGSPPYMSPEQFTLQEIDGRSDIYSLGVVAYQAITGVLPFKASEPMEWASLHMNAQPLPFEAAGDAAINVPDSMRRAVMRALSKDPAHRPQSMRELFQEFTLGTGTLPPGRMPSQVPIGNETSSSGSLAPRRQSDVSWRHRPSEPLPRPAAVPGGRFGDELSHASQPSISAHEIRPSDLPSFTEDAPSTLVRRAQKGTMVMATPGPSLAAMRDADGPATAVAPVRAKRTMPDTVPRTIRDPEALAEIAERATAKSKLPLIVGISLLLVGAGVGAFFFTYYTGKKEPKTPVTARAPVGDAPPLEIPTGDMPRTPRPPPSAAPTTQPYSPCQTAVFTALGGRCDQAKRSFARCSSDSSFYPSAARAMALCP